MRKKIDEVYAFLSDDESMPEFSEGIMGTKVGNAHMAMFCATKQVAESMREYALVAARSGRKCRLVRFSVREVIEEFQFGGKNDDGAVPN